jgi:hypothetical protein
VAALDKEPTLAEIAKIFADNEMQKAGPTLKVEEAYYRLNGRFVEYEKRKL